MEESFEPVIEIDKNEFTDQERDLILKVVARDEDILRQEKGRIEHLQDDLEELRECGVPEYEEETCGRVCRRCRTPLGLIFNSGALCHSCSKIVCKQCRIHSDEDEKNWICTFCDKVREIRAESGAWFYQNPKELNEETVKKKKKVYGSFLMKKVFSKVRRSDTRIYKDPDWSEVIHKETITEEDEDDKTYLVVSPSSSGIMTVSEGKDSSALPSPPTGIAVVASTKYNAQIPIIPTPAHIHTQATSSYEGLNHEERNTLLDIANRNPKTASSHEKVTYGELLSKGPSLFEKEEEEEEKAEKPTQASIYYDPGDEDSSLNEEEDDEQTDEEEQQNVSHDHQQEQQTVDDETPSNILDESVVEDEEKIGDDQQAVDICGESVRGRMEEDIDISQNEADTTNTTNQSHININEKESNDTNSLPNEEQEEEILEGRLKEQQIDKEATIEKSDEEVVSEEATNIQGEMEDATSSESELKIESEEEDMKEFRLGSSQQGHQVVNILNEEVVGIKSSKRDTLTKVPEKNGAVFDVDSDVFIDFSSMQKSSEVKNYGYVVHNDLDLKDLQKAFVRTKKMKFETMKTDEHSESSESSSSSDLDESDVEIKQVVPGRNDSFDDELADLRISEVAAIDINVLNEEEISHKPEKTKLVEENAEDHLGELSIDFASMQKVSEMPTTCNEDDNVDLDSFINVMTHQKFRQKKNKSRIEEDSDQEISSSSESESEIASVEVKINGDDLELVHEDVRELIAPNGITPNNVVVEPKTDVEDIDQIVAEFNQHADIGDADSIGSNYSDDEDVSENVQIAGELLLGFRYDQTEKMFEVQVHKAKDLITGNSLDQSTDPYVKIYLLPDTKRSAKKKTKVKKKTLNPDFDEILTFKLEYDQLLSRTIAASVWHSNFTHKNKCLGEIEIKVEDYLNSGFSFEDPLPQWYTLKGRVIKRDQILFCGDLVANIWFKAPGFTQTMGKKSNPIKGSLEINIIRAQNLKALYEGGYSNPFCKISLISRIGKTEKFKTHHIKGTVDPYWNKDFTFPNMALIDLQDAVLQFSVWDYEKGSAHVLLGGTRLGLGTNEGQIHDSFGEEVEIWQKVLDKPNEQMEYVIPLRSTLDSVKEKAFVPPIQVKHLTIHQHEEEKKKFGSLGNLASKKMLQPDTISLASTGSILSLYSMAGGEHGDLAITGELLFSVKYDDVSGIFNINIEKAKGLVAVDTKKMTSDPYVKVYLLPDKMKNTKKKTMHRRKTTNPIWNETIKYKLPKEELLQKTLQLTIWNHDRLGKNDCLGEVQLNMKQYANTNKLNVEQPVWYTLQAPAPVIGGGADENVGELVVGLKFDNGQLTVNIKTARALTTVIPNKLPNPFVKCYFLPDKGRKSKRKTGVHKKTINPVWNEKFSYKNVHVDELQTRVMEITIWDYDSTAHQFLGGVRLGLAQGMEPWNDSFKQEVAIWEAMISQLGILAEFTIPLRKSMTSIKNQIADTSMMISRDNRSLQRISVIQEEVIVEGMAALRLSLQYTDGDDKDTKKKKGALKVLLREAKCLPSKPDGELPSAYCRVNLYPKKKNESFKTNTYYKSLEPKFDADMVFEGVTLEELKTSCLGINIFDEVTENKKSDKGQQFASLRLGSGGLTEKWDDAQGPEVDFWFLMLNNPETWNTKTIPLRVHEFPEEKTKKSGNFSLKQITKPIVLRRGDEDLDHEDLSEEEDNVEVDESGRESPRTCALRAMGGEAAQEVIELMKQEEAVPFMPPSSEGLSTISEDNEEMESPAREIFQPPEIRITPDVKPGEPPFKQKHKEHNDDEPEFDYQIPEKKKAPPQMSFLKRSSSITSLTSITSTDSLNVYGQVPIRGKIRFALKYDNSSGMFEVHVFQAEGIASVDTKKETTDAYCKVYLLPDHTKGGKKKTRTRRKTLNPEWDEILEFKINHRDLRTRTLSLTIWHQERLGKNVFLGEVTVDMATVVDDKSIFDAPKVFNMDLQKKTKGPNTDLFKGFFEVSLMFEDDSLGYIKTTSFEEDKKSKKKKKKKEYKTNGKIHLHIKKATDLPAADKDGSSDPFCKVYLLPFKHSKSKRKTPVIKNTLNAAWDYRTEYDLDYEDLGDYGIEFTVWDWDRGNANDFLGCTRIGTGNKTGDWDDAEGIEVEAWTHLIENPNQWKDFKIPLRSKIDSRLKRK